MPAETPYSDFLSPQPGCVDEDPAAYTALIGDDGLTLYETPSGKLLRVIVKNNDVAYLRRYLAKVRDPRNPLEHAQQSEDDPYHTAARFGCNEALMALLEHWQFFEGAGQTTKDRQRYQGPTTEASTSWGWRACQPRLGRFSCCSEPRGGQTLVTCMRETALGTRRSYSRPSAVVQPVCGRAKTMMRRWRTDRPQRLTPKRRYCYFSPTVHLLRTLC